MKTKINKIIVSFIIGVGFFLLLINSFSSSLIPQTSYAAANTDTIELPTEIADQAESLPPISLEEVYQRVLAASAYKFTAVSEQTLLPRPLPEMIGQTNQRVDMQIAGEITLPDYSQFSVSLDGAGLDPTPITLIVEGSESYILREGEKIPVNNPASMASPTGDFVSYLAAAENVAPCETSSAPFADTSACYTFDINGPNFAEHVRDAMQEQVNQATDLTPPGVQPQVAPSPMLMAMRGQGKVWLDSHGLPLRQTINMFMPEMDDYYDAEVRTIIDYSFGAEAISAVQLAQTNASKFLPHLPPVEEIVESAQATLPYFFIFAFFVAIVAGLTILRRRRWISASIAIFLTLSYLTAPLLQVLGYDLYVHRQVYAADFSTVFASETAAKEGSPIETIGAADVQTDALAAPRQTFTPDVYCGLGANADRDGDGLADDAEYCLGTNPNEADTDFDGIDDGTEVAGFTFDDKEWYSDPLNPDSNQDGVNDDGEWSTAVGGTAASWDLDEDKVPNVWDTDDDGDGVSDRFDLSPGSFTEYFSPKSDSQTITDTFNFNISGSYDGYIYVNMQVQPSDLDHLRYGLTRLDWGYDNKGLIQDLDSSQDDIRLIPMLSVEANAVPADPLSADYNVVTMQDVDDTGYQEMLIPLSAVGTGGKSEAFSLHMAYGPETLADLDEAGVHWRNAHIVWIVQAKIDSENGNGVTSKDQPIHMYSEDSMRITGWNVTKSGRFNSAVIGTPDMPNDDRQLFQLLFGLSASYLNHSQMTLTEIDARFNGANTPIEQKWGVTTTVKVDTPTIYYAHFEEGVKDFNDRIKSFLADNYPMDQETVVILASESNIGIFGQDNLGEFKPSVNSLGVNLNQIYLIQQRSLELHMRDGWDIVSDTAYDKAVLTRINSSVTTAKQTLQDQYPNIATEQLSALTLAYYVTWQNGRNSILSIDGITSNEIAATDESLYERYYQAPLAKYNDPSNISTLPGYLVEVGNLGQKGSGLIFAGGPSQTHQYMQANFQEARDMGFTATLAGFINNVGDSLASVLGEAELDKESAFDKFSNSNWYSHSKAIAANAIGTVDTVYDTVKGMQDAVKQGATRLSSLKQTANSISSVSKVGVVLLVLDIGLQVGMFFAAGDYSPAAIAALLAGILLSIMLFVIALNPIGAIIVGIVAIVDLILLLVGLGDYQISGYVSKFLALAFYSSTALTRLDAESMKYEDRQTGLADQNMGYVAGNRFRVSDQFKAIIELARSDSSDNFGLDRLKQEVAHWGGISTKYLARSWACAEFTVEGWDTMQYSSLPCPSPLMGVDPDNLPTKESAGWTNQMTAEILLDTSGANLPLAITSKVTARTYNLNGGIVNLFTSGSIMSYDPFTLTLPDDLEGEDKREWRPQIIYLDILPTTVEELWAWSNTENGRILTNHDPDGDGMTTRDEINARLGSNAFSILEDDLGTLLGDTGFKNVSQLLAAWETPINGNTVESVIATDNNCPTNDGWPNLCDTNTTAFWLDGDSDDDGLTDKFEYDNQGSLGTNFATYDSDGDGLNDGFEYQIGTAINAKDTDGDGLTDDQEVYHPGENNNWTGGYTIELPEYGAVGPNGRSLMDVRVFSDPRSKDTDGDGMSDAAEKENGTSPTAYNRVPRVTLTGQPWAVSPTGQGAVYVGPNDQMTLTSRIDVFPPFTVSDTLTLDIPSSVMGANTTPSLNGSRTVPNSGYTQQPRWDFSNNVLQPWEYLYASTPGWSQFASSSRTATATLTLPYDGGDAIQSAELPIVLDADNPHFSLLTPAHGDLIGGGVTHYVMGGASNDATTWVDRIELDLPYIGSQTISDSLHLSPWAYTWELPADGIYNISGQAVDFVDNISNVDSARVMIDNTAPSVDVDLLDGAVYGPPQDSSVITITLSGSATENYSGLTRVQISTDNGPWREVWTQEDATEENTTYSDFSTPFYTRATGATWTADWTLPNIETVQGYHSLRVRAFDAAGNWPTPIERTIIIDVLPPTDDLVNRAYISEFPHVPANEPHTFRGVANDVGNVPQPSRPEELIGTLDSIDDATIWLGLSSIDENNGGVTVDWIGDFNGDRRGDLLVGVPAAEDGAGKVAVIYGRSGNWPAPDAQEMLAAADSSFIGLSGAGIGLQATAAGDVNGDGLADLIIGDATNNAVYLILGQNTYYGKDVRLTAASGVNIRRLQAPAGQQIGHNIAAAGDVNGDGYDDLLIGVTGSLDAAYLLLGQADPIWITDDIDQHAAAVIYDAGGATLSAAGDLDGDFRDEFAIGMDNTLYLFAGSGTFSPRAGLRMYADSNSVDSFSSGDSNPTIAALGDVDGDNKDDAIYSDGSSQHLILGDEALSDGSWTTHSYGYGAGFLAAPGDVDNDGRSDILIGNGTDAYLILGSDIGTAQATINGVAAAASTRYTAGADLNSDGSSDLLLVPTAASAQAAATTAESNFDLPPSWVPNLPEQSLETFTGSTTWPDVSGADAYVNSDGVCYGLTPCYGAIQTAVDATGTYDLIIVQPGVYDSFTISGSSHDNLTIRGMDPDAVIIDANGSSYAARIQDADSVRLEKMTLRNASYGLQLTDAGVGGHEDAQLAERTILDHVLIYDTDTHAVYIDRSSTITVSNSTLVRAGNHIGVDMSDSFDTTIDVGWQAETNPSMPHAFYDGGGLAVFDDILFYCTGGGMRQCQWKHIEDSSWFTPWAPPTDLEAGSTLAAGSDGQFYAVAAPGWDDMPDSPEQIVDSYNEGMIVSQLDGNLLAVPQLGQGFMEWNGSSWVSFSDGNVPYANYHAIAENPTNGDVAISAPQYGVFIWDGIQFTSVTTDNIAGLIYDTQGNLYAAKDTIEQDTIEKYDGSQWTTVTEVGSRWDMPMIADNQNNAYFADGSSIMRYDGSTLWSLSSVGSITNTVKSLAYDETVDKLFACTDEGIARYDNGWTMLPAVTTDGGTPVGGSCNELTYSGQIFASGEWYEDTAEGAIRINLARWNDFDEQWEPIGANELCVYGEPQWCEVENVAGGKLGLYMVGVDFNDIGDDNYADTGQKLAHYHFSTGVYSTTLNAWHTVAPPPAIGPGASMAGSDDGTLALIAGNGSDRVYTYDIATNQWDSNDTLEADQTPINVTASAMTFADGYFYAITNGGEFCSSGNGQSWSCFSEGDIDEGAMGTIDGGASLTYDPKFETFYAFTGGNGSNMLRYNTNSDTWELLPAERFTPSPIKPGAGLVFMPGEEGNSLYAVEGNYSGSNTGFWRYPIPEPNKIGFENSAIVVPPGSPSANWLSLSDPLPEDVNFRVGSGSLWFNSTGLPNNGGSLPRSSANPFLDSARNLYRMGEAGSSYTLGYHNYTAPVTATTSTGIQAMINTGANQVIVQPGIYEEDVYLVNGVELIGTNPDWTIIKPLSGSPADALVRAMGSNGASFSRFTLDGENSGLDGFAATGNAANLTVQRVRIYDTDTGITLDGPDSDVEVAHATVANNNSGLVATNCASIDVRNSIFAYHTGVGLSHQACADVQLHTYNLYWTNDSDFGADADAGAAELFLDPSFVDPLDHDYRTLNFSPVIDAGNPTDPAPPGAGSRADIGYIEQGRVNFYVDDSYCAICTNDGLTWQVDAFDNIQDALNAAENALANLNPSIADVPQLVVGVAPGTYNEQVTIPSHVLLFGSGAEATIIDAEGSGTAVSFQGVTDAGIRNLAVTNAETAVSVSGASNSIDLRRNLFTNNTTGLAVNGRATVSVEYNTFVNNSTGLLATDSGSWILAMHNIATNGTVGTQATNNGQIFSNYNLYFNTTDFDGVTAEDNDLVGQNPLFAGGDTPYRLSEASPAVDAASFDAPVPNGGGELADLGYSELLAAPITLLLGQEDLSTVMGNSGVATVEYGVVLVPDVTSAVTSTLPSEWISITLDTPGDTFSYWAQNHTPTEEGFYRFYSRATDMVGNQEEDALDWYDGSFVVDSTPPEVEWLTPPNGTSLQTPLELRAQVTDYAAGQFSVDENDVYFEIDGQRVAATWAAEPWDESAGEPRIFRAWVDVPVASYSNVVAGAEDKAGNGATDDSMGFVVTAVSTPDTTPPTVTLTLPAPDSWVTHTVQFAGTASDLDSGIASVEISLDGGSTWWPATVSSSDWSLIWDGPEELPLISYPAQVRATDRAGQSVVVPFEFTIDEVAPSGLIPVTFNEPEESHFDVATDLEISWEAPIDASGIITTFLTVDQITDTLPTDIVNGTTAVHSLNSNGDWYVHLGAMDAAGNMQFHHFGPWHVGLNEGLAFGTQQQSIIIDGYVDVDNNEWRLESEYLDDDERTYGSEVTYSPGGQQSFLTAWDADNYFMAWRGGNWTLDGELWIYLKAGGSGSNELIVPLASAPEATLPFAADYAIQITDPLSGTLYEYSGGWQISAAAWAFANGGTGDTEIRLPLFGTSNVEIIAFGLGDDQNVWSIFPATNPLNPGTAPVGRPIGLAAPAAPGDGWVSYEWADITAVTNVAANQPIAVALELALASSQATSNPWGPGSTLEYVITINNLEDEIVSGQPISIAASPASALVHDGINGATCSTTNPWSCTLDPLNPGLNVITLTTHLAANLSGLESVMVEATLTGSNIPPEMNTQDSVRHQVDGTPPEVELYTAPFVGLGSYSFTGSANDGDGAGVAYVEVRPQSGGWQRAEGTELWTVDLTVSPFAEHGDSWQFEVRAVDLYGQVSDVVTAVFTVDLEGPDVTFDSPTQLSGNLNEIMGSINDLPAGSEAETVLVQLDDGQWREATLFALDETSGSQPFMWVWNMPTKDGVTHTLRVQTTDQVGNIGSLSPEQTVWVDNVAPAITVTEVLTEVAVQHYFPGAPVGGPVLAGSVTDGTAVDSVAVWIELPDGTNRADTAVLNTDTGAWQYVPALQTLGFYKLQVRSWDSLGNQNQTTFYELEVKAAPESGPNSFFTPEDTPLTFEPLLDDIDIDSDTIYLDAVATPNNGSATIHGETQIIYTPTLNFNGTEVFTYTATDGQFTDSSTVTVTVLAVNDPPQISGPANLADTMAEDGTPLTFNLNGINVDDDTFSWEIIGGTGTAEVSNTSGTGNLNAEVTYTPPADFNGSDSFQVQVSDGVYNDSVTVEITVNPVDDAPRATDDYLVLVPADAALPHLMDVLANDDEVDGQTLQLDEVGTPTNGGMAVPIVNQIHYTTNLAEGESETVSYTVSDGVLTDTAVLHVNMVEGVASGEAGDTVVASGIGISDTVAVSLTIPPNVGSGDEQIIVVLRETTLANDPPQSYKFAGLSFVLDVYVDGVLTPEFVPNSPISIEISYSDADVAHIGRGDAELMLLGWTGSEWLPDGITLDALDTENNQITLTVDALTNFALFGKDMISIYLPIIVKP